MSKRPTFNDLIQAYGRAQFASGTGAGMGAERETDRAKVEATEVDLVRALRKAGIPLDQVAPQ